MPSVARRVLVRRERTRDAAPPPPPVMTWGEERRASSSKAEIDRCPMGEVEDEAGPEADADEAFAPPPPDQRSSRSSKDSSTVSSATFAASLRGGCLTLSDAEFGPDGAVKLAAFLAQAHAERPVSRAAAAGGDGAQDARGEHLDSLLLDGNLMQPRGLRALLPMFGPELAWLEVAGSPHPPGCGYARRVPRGGGTTRPASSLMMSRVRAILFSL